MDPKHLNSEDKDSCRNSMSDDDDDEDTADRVGLFDYYRPSGTSNGRAASSDNNSFSRNASPRTKESLWSNNICSNSYAKAQFDKQVAQKDATAHHRFIEKFKNLSDFSGNECGEVLTNENGKESEKTGAKDASFFQAAEYNEMVQKNNSEVFDEVLSCESGEQGHDIAELCCDAENERHAEFNSMMHVRNTEQFDEVVSIESDKDSVKNTELTENENSYRVIEEAVAHLSYSEQKELADSDLKVSELKVETNGYDCTSQRKAYSSKYSGSVLRSVDRCSSLLSSCGYIGGHSSTIDSEKMRDHPRPFVCSDQESETDVSCGVGNCKAIQSDDSDDSTKFCERTSELNIHHQPFFSQQDISEQGKGDWLIRGNSLHASSLRGYYPTPQYHLTRYPYSFNSDLEQPSIQNPRYCQLRLKRQYKRERQDAAVVNSTDVPGYKGNLDVEELLSYINDSKGLGCLSETHADTSGSRSGEKPGRRKKKGGSKGAVKPNRTESSSKSVDKRTCDAQVASGVKTKEKVRVKSSGKLNCIDTFSDEETDVCGTSRDEKIYGESIGGHIISDSSSTFQDACDIPQGNVNSIKTVTIDRELDKSLTQSSSSPVLPWASNDVSMQRSAATEDDFTMVTKKKKLKKSNSKRAKLPPSDCLPCFPVSSDSVESTGAIANASKESVVDCCQMKTRNSALSKFSNALRPLVDKTVTQDCGIYLEAHNEQLGNEAQKKLAKIYGKGVDVHVGVQSLSAAAPGVGEGKYDSAVSKSNCRHQSSQGRPTFQNCEKQESKKSLTSAETLLKPLQVVARASLESGMKQVTAEKQRHSKRPFIEQWKGRSVEKFEISLSRKQKNLSEDIASRPQKLSEDENVNPQRLVQEKEEEVISQKLSQNDKVISVNVSQDEQVISESLSDNGIVKPRRLSQNEEIIYQIPLQYETNVFSEISLDLSQIDTSLSQNPFPYGIEMSPQFGQSDMSISRVLAEHAIEKSEMLLPGERSLPQDGSLDDAFSAEVKEAFDSRFAPSEQPVVFLDRQRRLFLVPAKKDLGLKFGHFDDCEVALPDESRTPPFPGPPINIIHFIPVPYNDEDGPDNPNPDSSSMMYPIPQQYMHQLMYANGLPPMCKPAFQVYSNGHLFQVPMQFAPFLPPGFCVPGLSHTTNVPVGVVSPTMNNSTREETLSPESIPVVADLGDSCAAGFATVQSLLAPMEPISQYRPQPELAKAIMASVSLSNSRRSKSVFNLRTAVDYLYSEWLNVRRKEHEPNSGVVRYNPELDL